MSALPNDPLVQDRRDSQDTVGERIHLVLPLGDVDACHKLVPFAPSTADAQVEPGGRDDSSPPGSQDDPQPSAEAIRADALLLVLADELDGLEALRIAMENRLRAFATDPLVGPSGGHFGKGMGGTAQAAKFAGRIDAISALEHQAVLDLQRAMRAHPLGPWVKGTVGVGEKQAARLLAAIGDPAARRTVSQLWAYCGLHVLHPDQRGCDTRGDSVGVDTSSVLGPLVHDAQNTVAEHASSSDPAHSPRATQAESGGVAPKRAKGVKSNWSTTAKTRAILVATSCIKQAASPYRATYDDRRAHTAVTHPDWTPGHSHNDAIRVTAKEVLKDLWREARAVS